MMDNPVARIQFWFKRGLALVLFVTLLVGASATAFYALAAGISALSGFAVHSVVTPGTFSQTPSSPNANEVTVPGTTVTSATGTDSTGNSVPTGAEAGQTSPQLASTVGAAIDGGGFALGNRIEGVFGSVLGGVLNTLFLDQPSMSKVAGGSSGQRN